MALGFGPGIVTNGLVLNIDAANKRSYIGSGTTIADISSQKTNGVLTNGPIYNSSNGGSIVFDGIDDYISVPNGGGLNNAITYTIDIWFKYISTTQDTGAAGYGALCGRQKNTFWSSNLLYINGANPTTSQLIFYHVPTGPSVVAASSIGTGINNCIITCTASDLKMYINGAISSSSTGATLARDDSTIPLSIGAWIGGGASYSNSYIYNFKVYNRGLSSSEVLQNYNATKGRFV